VIKDWFAQNTNLSLGWKVDLFDTGLDTQTGGRIKKVLHKYSDEQLIVTYGDGLGNVNLNELSQIHKSEGKLATVTAVRPPARFGQLEINGSLVSHFGEKNQADAGWINGGFFILEPQVSKYILADSEPFEVGALPRLVEQGNLSAYKHEGFWQPMDTLREKHDLQKFVLQITPPWLSGIIPTT
jgi:glucose-1-phosphate cytidylyltransferase